MSEDFLLGALCFAAIVAIVVMSAALQFARGQYD